MATKPAAKEYDIQKAFFQWVHAAEKVYPELRLLFSVPNEGKRSFKVAAMLKATGLRKGLLDCVLAVPRRGFSGMVIEFKRPGEKLREEQEDYAAQFQLEGWHVVIMTDADAAVKEVKWYIGITERD